MPPRRPEHLKGVVNGDQRARQHRRHREFDHHHPIERRGGKDDDRAEAGLNETEPDDTKPGEHGIVHGQPTLIAASANALMSMPTT